MRFHRNEIVRLCVAPAALGLALAAGGCGSGDGGGGTAAPLQITGTVKNTTSGAVLSGYTVSFDASKTETAATSATGAFTLTVPRADVSGTDTLTLTDPSGVLVDKVSLPASSKTSLTYNAGALDVSPPSAPFVVHQ